MRSLILLISVYSWQLQFPNSQMGRRWSVIKDDMFVECVRDAFLTQMVSKPTRRRKGQTPNLLDLVLVSEECLVSDMIYSRPAAKSDHETLLFSLYIYEIMPAEQEDSRYDLSKANFAQMRQDCESFDWSYLHEVSIKQC